jgi:dTDP-4-dehydrorhamnose 3,5-epimerase
MTPIKKPDPLSIKDFDKDIQQMIKTQDYTSQPKIKDVEVKDINHFNGEDGYFAELGRFEKGGNLQGFPGFKTKQISRSILEPGAIKAFHIHFRQDDIWYVAPESWLLVGLVDLRIKSPTYKKVMKFALGSIKPRLLRIPKGVAHGAANLSSRKTELIYFTDQYFTTNDTDEHRLPWDFQGKDFWEMTKG